jgi:hypothetical protein
VTFASPRLLSAIAASLLSLASAPRTPVAGGVTFHVARRAEALATVTVRCDACAWDTRGREAVTLRLTLDDRYSQHLLVVRSGRAEYGVMLGALEPGDHVLRLQPDRDLTAAMLGLDAAIVEDVAIEQLVESSPNYLPVSLAPIVHARPNTIGKFTDVPVFMWYETEPTPRGTRYRYSVIFTNEDGGTPTDRLMATWGRTTDIEYIYSVEVDASGRVLADDLQGPEHKILAFRGAREGRHPLLWVTTDNNMVEDRGTTNIRHAPVPVAFSLKDVSREAVMDANPWLYRLASEELIREGKIVQNAPPGQGTIPDPRQFVYIEACGEVGDAALAFEVGVRDTWVRSDRGVPQYTIVRDGCFRAAVPVNQAIGPADLRGLRVAAYPRPTRDGIAAGPSPAIRFDRVNKMFMLDERYVPGPSVLEWTGPAVVESGKALLIHIPH